MTRRGHYSCEDREGSLVGRLRCPFSLIQIKCALADMHALDSPARSSPNQSVLTPQLSSRESPFRFHFSQKLANLHFICGWVRCGQ